MAKRIWIVNYYTGTPDNATNPRYLQFSHHFQKVGYDVITFNASYRPGAPQELIEGDGMFEEHQYGEHRFVHVRCPRYVGNGLKRMYSIWAFAWRLYKHCNEFDKPDVILHNIHTPFDYPIVWMAKKLNAKYIAEAWDLWPEDFVTFGLVSRKNPVLHFFYWVEKKLYYHADQLVFTFLGAFDYLKRKGWTTETGGKIDMSRVHYINSGIDLEQFDSDKVAYPRPDEDINQKDIYKIIYLGSVNLANHVKTLIDAAFILQKNPKYQFFIYGNGADRDFLEQYVKDKEVRNVHFKEYRIPLCECAWVVSQATVNVMNYEKGFGHLGVSSGKLWQYLAAGKPIVCNIDIAYDDVITDNNLGVAYDIDTPEEFADAIQKCAEKTADQYKAMCERVRKTANRFDYKNLAAEEIKVVEAALAGK